MYVTSDSGKRHSVLLKLTDNTEPRGLTAMKEASRIAEQNGISDMTLDEINAEIRAARG